MLLARRRCFIIPLTTKPSRAKRDDGSSQADMQCIPMPMLAIVSYATTLAEPATNPQIAACGAFAIELEKRRIGSLTHVGPCIR